MDNNNNYQYNYDPNQNPNQNAYYNNMSGVDPVLEKKAETVKTLGIVSLVTSILLMCCCTLVGPVTGIIGLVKANELSMSMNMLSPKSQDSVKNGKLMCIIGIVLGVIGIIVNVIMSATGATEAFWEGFKEGLEESCLMLNIIR